MMHVVAYRSSIAQNTLAQITNVTDAIIRTSGNGFQVQPQIPNVMAVWGVGASLNHIQLQAQSLRKQPFPTYRPINVGTAVEAIPKLASLWDSPLVLAGYEELDAYGYQTGAAAEDDEVFVIFGDTAPQPMKGNFLRARWTATGTLTANAWSAVTPAFDTSLEVGNYAIVGGYTYSAGGLAFRIVPASGNAYRAGGVCVQAQDSDIPEFQKPGRSGVWMTFNSLTPPQIELFSGSADTAENGELYLMPMP